MPLTHMAETRVSIYLLGADKCGAVAVLGLQHYRVSEAPYERTVIRGISLRGNDNARNRGEKNGSTVFNTGTQCHS